MIVDQNRNLEAVVARLSEQVERRFYGKYRGQVVDNADPRKLGRLKVSVPSVLGTEEVTGWAMPCVPFGGEVGMGFLFVPEVGAGVWVEFEEGDLEFPIWTGTFWSEPDGESEVPVVNEADGSEKEIQDPPTRKIIKTAAKHSLQFEDASGGGMVLLHEAEHQHIIVMDSEGIKVIDGANGHEIVLTSAGITITDATQNQIEMSDSAFNIISKKPLTIDASGQAIVLIGDTIDFNKG